MSSCDLLVTGAHGFVGRHLVERARGDGRSVRLASGDLRDVALVESLVADARPAAVIHLASPPRGGRDHAWQALTDELRMASALLQAVEKHAPDAPLLIPGSAAQYGMGLERPLREEDPTEPLTAYGARKCVVEVALMARALRGASRIIWTRSFNHIGPGQGEDAPAAQWAMQVAKAERSGAGALTTGRLDAVRDFLDVRDVVDAYLALAASSADGVVNVCSGSATPLRELAELFTRMSAVPIALRQDSSLERALDPPRVVGDPTRLERLTGWRPRIPLEQSVRDLLEEHRALVTSEGLSERVTTAG